LGKFYDHVIAARTTRVTGGRPCLLSILHKTKMDEETWADLQALIADGDVPAPLIASELGTLLDRPMSDSLIKRHRRGECHTCQL
jgi:hypothetical protein